MAGNLFQLEQHNNLLQMFEQLKRMTVVIESSFYIQIGEHFPTRGIYNFEPLNNHLNVKKCPKVK